MPFDQSEGWRRVASRADIPADGPLACKWDDEQIVLVELEGQVFALNNICPHAFALMSEGFLDGDQIECPLHGAVFNVRTGKCLDGPTDDDLPSYEVQIDGEDVWVKITQ